MGNLNGVDVAIITVVGTLVLCAIIAYVVIRKVRGSAYEGIIESKGSAESEDTTRYFIVVKLTGGATKRVYIS